MQISNKDEESEINKDFFGQKESKVFDSVEPEMSPGQGSEKLMLSFSYKWI